MPAPSEVGELFAVPAAVAVHNAAVLAQAQHLTAQLLAALTSRGVIDQAVGILISRSGATAAEAFESLRAISQKEHTKLAVIAGQVVAEAGAPSLEPRERRPVTAQARHRGAPLPGAIAAPAVGRPTRATSPPRAAPLAAHLRGTPP